MNENWSISKQDITRVVDGTTYYRVVIECDTVDDLPEPDPTWDAGSIACIADPHSYRKLNHQGEWK